jgi:hypothetical protein
MMNYESFELWLAKARSQGGRFCCHFGRENQRGGIASRLDLSERVSLVLGTLRCH